MKAVRCIGRAFRRLTQRRVIVPRTHRPTEYAVRIDGRRLSDAESDHILRVLVFAGDDDARATTPVELPS